MEYLPYMYASDAPSVYRPLQSLGKSHGATLACPFPLFLLHYLFAGSLPSFLTLDLRSLRSESFLQAKLRAPSPFLIMDPGNSSSESGPSVEDRMEALESALSRLRARVDQQNKQLQDNIKAGERAWDILNEDIRKLRDDLSSTAGSVEDLKEDTQTEFKDEAIVHGNFGNRICALEEAISRIQAKIDK